MNRKTNHLLFFTIILLGSFFKLSAQADPVAGFSPRLLTRAKLWDTFRNNGLQGGGNKIVGRKYFCI